MAATARRISSTNLRERILPDGYPFELASLAGTFNQMLDRLEDSFERITDFPPTSRMTCARRSTIFAAKLKLVWREGERSLNTAK